MWFDGVFNICSVVICLRAISENWFRSCCARQSYRLTTAFIIMAFNTICVWYNVKQNVYQQFHIIISLKFTEILIPTKMRLGWCTTAVSFVCALTLSCWIQWNDVLLDALIVPFYRFIFMFYPFNIPIAKHPQFCFSPLVWFALIFIQGFLGSFMWQGRKWHCVNTEMLATQSSMAMADVCSFTL